MQVGYRISEDDYVNASKLFAKVTPRLAWIYTVAVICLVAAAVFGGRNLQAVAIGGLIGGVSVTLVCRWILAPIMARRHYRKYKAIQDDFSLELLDDGILFKSTSGEGTVSWDNILKWRHNDSYILIYPMPRLYHIIPKSVAGDGFNVDQLIESLRVNVGDSV